ncbi:MAG: hypothetical protein AB8I08_29950 [Sandaracinaceae bacterium]
MRARPTFALALVLLVGCRGGLSDPTGPDDGPDGPSAEIASLSLSAPMSVLAVGQSTFVSVTALDGDGATITNPTYTLAISPDGVIDEQDDGSLEGVAEGTVSITASTGDITSEPVEIQVVMIDDLGDPSVRIEQDRLVLTPSGESTLNAEVRDGFGQRVPEPRIEWRVADGGVLSVDEEGHATAGAAGSTTVTAVYSGIESPPIDVLVADGAYLAVDWVAPSGPVAGAAELHVAVRVQTLTAGSPSAFGLPKTPSLAEVRAGDQVLGSLSASFGEARGTVSLDGLSPGAHTLTVRVEADGQTATSARLGLTVAPRADTFEVLGESEPGDQGDILMHDGVLYRVANDCQRECRTYVHRWDGTEWQAQTYRQREWDSQGDWQNPSGYTEDIRDTSNLSLPKFVGWGWPPRSARDPRLAVMDGNVGVVWSNQEARTSFNLETMPAHYWFDCYGAQWSASAGHDGAGGYELLSDSGRDYLYRLPHPDSLGNLDEYQFPAGADTTRTNDCADPQPLATDAGFAMAMLTGPVPGTDWGIEVRRWDGGAWADVAPRHAFEGAVLPELQSAITDGSGRVVAAVTAEQGESGVVRFADGAWTSIEDGSRGLRALAAAGDQVLGAGVRGGDLRVFLGDGDRWSTRGFPLEGDPWASVGEVALLVDGDTQIIAWTEGPEEGNRVLRVARWNDTLRIPGWQRLAEGPLDAEPDVRASHPRLSIDDAGHLYVLYTEHAGGDDPFVQRVLRSREPVQ